ncbi:hypothetical protein [Nonomuraea lactucae]|uniref:hypothetical protein n=1 Tax=Nonomuraea lactucae TaxID=2249762 RepID=UPI0013B424B2|nr:hypothetical protein [Nonomuraea lactucae]
MRTRSTAVLATGSANTAKLFVAALAFTGAYVGFSAYDTASSAPRPTQTISLSAREVPVKTSATPATTPSATPSASPTTASASVGSGSAPTPTLAASPGTLLLGSPVAEAGCARTYEVRGMVVNPAPGATALYNWRLTRWSPQSNTWQDYLVELGGFAGARESVEWHPRITGNPGWYRVELAVKGAGTVKSQRFQVSC